MNSRYEGFLVRLLIFCAYLHAWTAVGLESEMAATGTNKAGNLSTGDIRVELKVDRSSQPSQPETHVQGLSYRPDAIRHGAPETKDILGICLLIYFVSS